MLYLILNVCLVGISEQEVILNHCLSVLCEVVYKYEFSIADPVTSTTILYCGADVLHSWTITERRWESWPILDNEWGAGLEAGVEFRGYMGEERKGLFASAFSETSVKWWEYSGDIRELSFGLKLGSKNLFNHSGVSLEYEPNLSFSLRYENERSDGWQRELKPNLSLGISVVPF